VNDKVTLIGHPFAPIGMGEHFRALYRSLRASGVNMGVLDVYGSASDDSELKRELEANLVQELGREVNIFVLNGDEVEASLKHLSSELPSSAFNIIYPAWELPKYPDLWAEQLEKFDEVWTTSKFTHESLRAAVSRPVWHMPLPGEISLGGFAGRRYFGIPESSFVFLFVFDFTSYIQRKNPFAVLQAFEEVCKCCPNEDLFLVVKVKSGERKQNDYDLFRAHIRRYKERFLLIDKLLSDTENKNLLRCSDCFVSLHRSEGFGLGLIAAMYMGKPVVATAYSGNMDFMTDETSCPVRYNLCSVPEGAYPFSDGQVWAEPDISHAANHMVRLVSSRSYAHRIGENASVHIRVNFSYRSTGLRYLGRISDALASLAGGMSSGGSGSSTKSKGTKLLMPEEKAPFR
jgi:glycosyltransferase involved in cell wall biosynthesis